MSLKKTPQLWLLHAKTSCCYLESHAIILWSVISIKLNIRKKIAGLEKIMALNQEKI